MNDDINDEYVNLNEDDEDIRELPYNQAIGTPELTLRFIENLSDEFFYLDHVNRIRHNNTMQLLDNNKYLLIEILESNYYYDFHNETFKVVPSFSSLLSYTEPFREYIVSAKSFLLAGEIADEDEDEHDGNANDEVKFHFIWTRLRGKEELSTRVFNYDRPWDYINNNLNQISPRFPDPDPNDVSNYWIAQRDIYQNPIDPNFRRPRFVLFHLGEHGRKITEPLGLNRPTARDITPNDIPRLINRGQRIFSGVTTNDMYGKAASVIEDVPQKAKARRNREDFENVVAELVDESKKSESSRAKRKKTDITDLNEDNIFHIGSFISKKFPAPKRGGKIKSTKKKVKSRKSRKIRGRKSNRKKLSKKTRIKYLRIMAT